MGFGKEDSCGRMAQMSMGEGKGCSSRNYGMAAELDLEAAKSHSSHWQP
jgi:hypothetical protein